MSNSSEHVTETERRLDIVVQTGLLLARSSDLDSIVQAVVDAGVQLSGAQFGAFFYNIVSPSGERYLLYKVSGVDRERFSEFPMPRNTQVFAPTFHGTHIVRLGDITKDPCYGHNAPYEGMPPGHLPVRSYLAAPVKSPTGEVLGGLFFGHEQPGIFLPESENLIAAIAAQANLAIENTRLRDQLTNQIGDLQYADHIRRDAVKRLSELAAIVESSDDAILSKDLNGTITSWNQAATRILGYTAQEMIGHSILKLIPPHLHDDEKAIIRRIKAGERIEHFETVRLTKSGELLEVSLTVSPVRDITGNIIGASKILRDISGRKRIETSLLQAEKIAATGRMAATIAHEINNPLEAVINLLYLLRPSITDVEGIGYLNAAESELNRVAHIAKQTLGYYRENASASLTSFTTLAEHAIAIYEPRCTASAIRIERSLSSTAKVVLRRGEMMQVISNLIANAIYAMPNGGVLRLATEDASVPSEGVIFRVSDNGVGIASEHLPHVFEAFFTTRSTIGTGIGLFVVKQFVEGHGGKISIDTSVEPAMHGTAITVFLPLHTAYEETENPV